MYYLNLSKFLLTVLMPYFHYPNFCNKTISVSQFPQLKQIKLFKILKLVIPKQTPISKLFTSLCEFKKKSFNILVYFCNIIK